MVWREGEYLREDFAIFILTHGRPYNQDTRKALRKSGYTGKIYLVVDNLDETANIYRELYPDVIVFDKMKYVELSETGVSKPHIKFALFARNAIEDIAKDVNFGLNYFAMVDDDLTKFRFRYEKDGKLRSLDVNDMDSLLTAYIEFMENGNIATTSLASQFQFVGGISSVPNPNSPKLRMCFNFYIRSVKHIVEWLSNICHDRITSITYGRKGQMWFQIPFVQYDMRELHGINEGGNSDVYREITDFYRIFFSTLFLPDCNYAMYWKNGWVNKVPNYDTLCPMLISDKYSQ